MLFLGFDNYFCFSQSSGGDDNNRIEVVKKGYITQELNLTPEESKNFWPVYNNYADEIRQARNQYPNDEVAFEKKVVEIKENYKGNFKKVLGSNKQRLNKVYTTDKQFNNALRNELKNRQQMRMQNNNNQPAQNQFRRKNKTLNQNNNINNNNKPKRLNNKRKPNNGF